MATAPVITASAEQCDAILAVVIKHKVVVFFYQILDNDQHAAFADL